MGHDARTVWLNCWATLDVGGDERRVHARSLTGRTVMVGSRNPLPEDANGELKLFLQIFDAGEGALVKASCRVLKSEAADGCFLSWLEMDSIHEGAQWLWG